MIALLASILAVTVRGELRWFTLLLGRSTPSVQGYSTLGWRG